MGRFTLFVQQALLAIILVPTQGFAWEFKGVAKSLDGKKELYREQHSVTSDDKGLNLQVETNYLSPEGKLIARLRSDFSRHAEVPDSVFEDFRFKRKETLKLSEDKKTVMMTVQENDKITSDKKYDLSKSMVAGQGFDNFIKANFSKLARKDIVIKFGVMAKADFFTFKAYQISADKERARFGIKLDSIFLRMFVDELKVDYHPKSKRLLRYRGLSNLLTDSSDDQQVQIDYTYDH